MINIILCGGSGTRLWPISRALMPKQFVKLFDDTSLFQLTCKRNSKLCSQQLIVSNTEQYFLALDQLEEIQLSNNQYSKFLLEPLARNTAPAIALACMALHEDDIVLVTPSDHLIKNENSYFQAAQRAKILASEGYIVTFGITPSYPETGFGYIESMGEDVNAFHEKPNAQIAQNYFIAGNYYWNSGMFCFQVKQFLKELECFSPEIFTTCQKAYQLSIQEKSVIRIKHEDMLNIPEESIDYAVMEKSTKVKMVASNIEWSDVGSFDALCQEFPKDDEGNNLCKKHININSKNNFILSSTRKISTIDIEDLIIIDTADALLISKKGSSQKVKQVVSELKKRNTDIHNTHLTLHRPWGAYTVLEDTLGYKIKRIVVMPGKRLSLQKHFHRSEHWTVVSGTAVVTIGEREIPLRANESIHIPMGELHRLENAGKLNLVIIETQIGDYLGEDDIVRIEDDYKRS